MHKTTVLGLSLLGLVASLGGPAAAEAKSLHWSQLAVEARLDADGALHVSERQTIVFTGEWNGGQRIFRLETGQRIELHRISRLDRASGEVVALTRGGLDAVDRWGWAESKTARWRSRLPSDPPFADTSITYVLDYTLTGILRQEGERFLMAHDFVFPEREGRIERFTLDLTIDPAWEVLGDPPACCELSDLPPGASVVVERMLARADGAGAPTQVLRVLPGGVLRVLPGGVQRGLFAASLAAMFVLLALFWNAERRSGRFERPELPEPLDREWLQHHVFDLPPEVVGALWDEKVGPPEVAAILARLELEGKLRSSVEPKTSIFSPAVLELELLVPLDELSGYEHKLIRKLFVGSVRAGVGSVTDTATIRKHYRKTGFSPVQLVEPALTSRVKQIVAGGGEGPRPSPRPTLWLFLAAGVALAVAAIFGVLLVVGLGFLIVLGMAVPVIFGILLAISWRKRVQGLGLAALGFVLPAAAIWLLCLGLGSTGSLAVIGLPRSIGLPLPLAVGLALLPVAFLSLFLYNARIRQGREVLRKRQLLAAARRELERQLGRERPDLDDAWLPYLLAFGLHRRLDGWWRSFGGEVAVATGSGGHGAGAAGGGGIGSWSGGGGSFGGAGATASWGAAAAGLAAGVSAPSSSGSGGGGGGGGGGSSGGGGGGGW